MERRDFLKTILATPVALTLNTKEKHEDYGVRQKDKPNHVLRLSALERIMIALMKVKHPNNIYLILLASDVFAELTDEFDSKSNIHTNMKPRLMYFISIPILESVVLDEGRIVIYQMQRFVSDKEKRADKKLEEAFRRHDEIDKLMQMRK